MRNLILSALLVCSSTAVQAATLTNDQVNIAVPGFGALDVVVGAGVDLDLSGTTFDLDAGANGDTLVWDNTAYASNGLITSVVFSDLDFSGGQQLVGFNVTSNQLQNLNVSLTSNSLTFTFDAWSPITVGAVVAGTYLTAPVANQLAPVPLPATAPLLVLGAAGLVAMRRRKARS